MKSWIIVILPIIFGSIPIVSVAEDYQSSVKEVVASGEAVVEQLTPEEARQMAVRKARACGIEKALDKPPQNAFEKRRGYSYLRSISGAT